jgi:hypothetical protein
MQRKRLICLQLLARCLRNTTVEAHLIALCVELHFAHERRLAADHQRIVEGVQEDRAPPRRRSRARALARCPRVR